MFGPLSEVSSCFECAHCDAGLLYAVHAWKVLAILLREHIQRGNVLLHIAELVIVAVVEHEAGLRVECGVWKRLVLCGAITMMRLEHW